MTRAIPLETPAAAGPAPASRRELFLVMAGLMLALTLAALDQNIVATALPRIVGDLGGLAHLSWVVTAFLLASTSSTPLYGKFSDIYGRKRAFMVSIGLFLVGSVLCGLSESMTQLILFRAIQGLGAGGLITLAQTTIGDVVSPRERGRYQGLFAAVFAGCSVAGPLLGGFLTDALSWRWIFYVNLPVGAAALFLIAIGLKSRVSGARHRIDYAGAVTIVAATTATLLVLSWGGSSYAWFSPTIVTMTIAAIALFVVLAVVESRAAEPILPPRLFHNRVFITGGLCLSLTAMAMFGAVVFLPLFFQLLQGSSPTGAGLQIAPMMGGVITASIVGGRLVSKTGRYKAVPAFGLAVATVGFLGLCWLADRPATIVIEFVLIALGLGIGCVFPNLTTAIQNAVDQNDLGVATSAAAFFRSLGGALGVAVSGAILTSQLQTNLPAGFMESEGLRGIAQIAGLPLAERTMVMDAYRGGLSTTFIVGAAVAALGFLMALLIPELPLRSSRRPDPTVIEE